MRWGHLTWPGDLTLRDLGLKFLQHVRKRCMIRCAKNDGAARRRFWTIWKKPEGGRFSTTPPPAGRRLKHRLSGNYIITIHSKYAPGLHHTISATWRRLVRIALFVSWRNDGIYGSKLMSFNIETSLSHSRRLPVSVRVVAESLCRRVLCCGMDERRAVLLFSMFVAMYMSRAAEPIV